MATATFGNPVSVIVEPNGDLVVCDWDTNIVRRVTPDGTVSTVVKQSNFKAPFGLAYSPTGAMYVATDYNTKLQKASLTGTVWRLDPVAGTATVLVENVGRPRGLASFPDGTVILADYQNYRVLLLDPVARKVTGLAGLGRCPGLADGKGNDARFSIPYGVAPLPDGKVLVADLGNHVLRVVASDGTVTTFSGDGKEFGTVDGPRMQARFDAPKALTIDGAGNIYVSDTAAHRIRRIGTDGMVTTVAGDGISGFKDGTGAEAHFEGQEGITVTTDGKTIYVADGTGGVTDAPFHRLRKITIAP
jgi:sugar lactone lactonase YvrE